MAQREFLPPPVMLGIRGRCPRCGNGHLFNGFLKLRKSCEVCDLDYSFADPADGPAFFVMIFGCVPSAILAVWLEVSFHASVWTQLFVTGSCPIAWCSFFHPRRVPVQAGGISACHGWQAD
jgi:uncharacterized protein (DUF983 family)